MLDQASRDIIVIGASAGGVEALRALVADLPADLPASIFVVIHTAPRGVSLLARILDRAGPLPAAFAQDGDPIRAGRIYVAPPDRHLLVREEHVHLSRGPKENRTRPAVNPLFRTAAASHGARVVGVILTGMLDNGTAGLLAVEHAGGTTIVQDPEDAAFPGMPVSALDYVDADHVVAIDELATLLARLATPVVASRRMEHASAGGSTRERTERAMDRDAEPAASQPLNRASGFTCPECSGALWEVGEHGLKEYVCRIGHLFGLDTLLEEQANHRDDLLEAALRALREEAALTELLVERGRERGHDAIRLDRHALRIEELTRAGDQLEELVRRNGPPTPAP